MPRLRPLAALLGLTGLVSACSPGMVGPPPGAPLPPPGGAFRPDEFSWSAVPGRNAIAGHVGYRQGGVRYSCAGSSVVLTPETPWSRRRMTILYASAERAALPTETVRARTPSAANDDYSAFVRRSACDSGDRFSFTGLPDGAWFAITVAKPAVKGGGPSVALMRRVVTRGGRVTITEL